MRYIKNSGLPSKITINNQAVTEYLDKDGRQKKIVIICWREEGSPLEVEGINVGAEQARLTKEEKIIINFTNGEVDGGKEIRDIDYTFQVLNFPHIVNFPIGTSLYSRKVYTLKVGEVTEIENDTHADLLLKQYDFLDEVNQKGEMIKKGIWEQQMKQTAFKANVKDVPKQYEIVSSSAIPRTSSVDKRVKEFAFDEGGIVK